MEHSTRMQLSTKLVSGSASAGLTGEEPSVPKETATPTATKPNLNKESARKSAFFVDKKWGTLQCTHYNAGFFNITMWKTLGLCFDATFNLSATYLRSTRYAVLICGVLSTAFGEPARSF